MPPAWIFTRIGSVSLAGTINAKDTVTITIDTANYTYTVLAADTLATVTQALVELINKAPDPNVIAAADTQRMPWFSPRALQDSRARISRLPPPHPPTRRSPRLPAGRI